jgi:hypothetical protein
LLDITDREIMPLYRKANDFGVDTFYHVKVVQFLACKNLGSVLPPRGEELGMRG